MKPLPRAPAPARLAPWILCIAGLGLLPATPAAASETVVAVASKISKDYVRKKLPDGTYKPETYAFGKGDNWAGARVDSTVDHMDFMDVARILAVPLAEKRYLPTKDPNSTDELILVTWGTTRAPENATDSNTHQLAQQAGMAEARAVQDLKQRVNSPEIATRPTSVDSLGQQQSLAAVDGEVLAANIGIQAENQRRENDDMRTATLLGYDSWWTKVNGAWGGSPLEIGKADMRAELEEDRYFVVLTALDYRTLVKERKSKMLWEVRFSIREHGNAFDSRIAAMAKLASDYFGRDSKGLHHDPLPEGKVEIGPVKSLGVVSDK
jgi:hypothetical protein